MVYRFLPSVKSVGVAVITANGSGNETIENNGISHFIEHMMFKGTKNRSAFDIVENADSLGAQINAFTSKTITCFYTLSLNEVVPQCMDILSDIMFNHTYDKIEMEREKGVVLEEIAMSEDDNADLVFDLGAEAYFNKHPLGMTILGPKENIKSFTQEQLFDYVNNNYLAGSTVISVVGNLSYDKAVSLVEDYFEGRFKSNSNRIWQDQKFDTSSRYLYKFKDIEQSNFTINMPGVVFNDPDSLINLLVHTIVGGGMSSRLFQDIREKQGLAYNVYSSPSYFINNGITNIYVGTNVNSVKKAISSIKECILDVCDKGLTQQEVDKGRMQLKSSYIMGQESTSSLMIAYGKQCLLANELFNIEDKIEKINSISLDDVNRVLRNMFDIEKASLAYIGPKIEGNLLELFK